MSESVLETMAKADMEVATRITGPCSCHEAYTSRGLIAPDCDFHDMAQEIAEALAETRANLLTALEASGMAVVPVEPTREMNIAGAAKANDFFSIHGPYPRTKAVWRAMLAAHTQEKDA